jgi:hypothetical protein
MEGACAAGCVNIIINGNTNLFLRILLKRSPLSYSVRTTISGRMPFIVLRIVLAFLARMAGANVSARKSRAVSCTSTVKMEVAKKIQHQLTPWEMYAPQMGATQGAIQVSIP